VVSIICDAVAVGSSELGVRVSSPCRVSIPDDRERDAATSRGLDGSLDQSAVDEAERLWTCEPEGLVELFLDGGRAYEGPDRDRPLLVLRGL